MFDALKFVGDRNSGKRVDDAEAADFQLFNALMTISMDERMLKHVVALNTREFSHLPSEIQAKLFNGFNNRDITVNWCRAKTSLIAEREAFIEKAMKVYDSSYNTIVECIRHGLIDRNYVEEKYAYKFELKAPKTVVPKKG